MIEHLRDAYSETTQVTRRMANGTTFEILTSQKGSWTMIVTAPAGRSCAEASGRD